MLRPYFAVVKDSFRAAVANRVLYVMIALVTLFLIALFPLGIEEQLNSEISQNDLVDAVSLSRRLVAASKSEEPSPARRLWEKMDEEDQKRLLEIYDSSDTADNTAANASMERIQKQARSMGDVINTMNELLEDPDFYDEDSWSQYSLDPETKDLLEVGPEKLNKERLARLNRLLLNTGFGREMNPGPPTSIKLKYAIWTSPTAAPIRKEELPQYLNIPYWLDKLVLSIGVFVAILVTAPVIPQTLEPGSLNLLLSKPVNRWALFLAKYLGACAFTVVLSTYLFLGLWLFFGTRIGIWDAAFIFCIPLYVLVFAIYFAVSALAGAVFRNTIVAVVLSILFWLLCFLVGTTYSLFDGIYQNFEIRQVVVADDELFQIDKKNVPYVWNEEEGKWKRAFVSETNREFAEMVHFFGDENFSLPEMFGPVYDAKNDRMLTAQTSMMFAGSSLAGGHLLGIGTAEDNWVYNESFPLPGLSVNLFLEKDNRLIAVTRMGTVYRLKGDPVELMEEFEKKMDEAAITPVNQTEDSETAVEADGAVFNPDNEGNVDFDVFEEVGPSPPLDFSQPASITMNPETGELLCYSRGNLEIVEVGEDGQYRRGDKSSLTLPGAKDLSAKLWFAGSTIIVARGNGEVFTIDRPTMDVKEKFEPEKNAAIRQLVGSNDGKWFALVFDNGNLWLADTTESEVKIRKAKVRGQGDISSAAFADDGSIFVADRLNRVRKYRLDGLKLEETYSPNEGFGGFLYRYVLIPVYVICPKPGEFYRLVTYLTSDDEADVDLDRKESDRRNPWEPLWNGLIFIGVMLSLGCLYLERQDF